MTTMRSHSAATSCMMWLENSTQRPSRLQLSQEIAQAARGHDVEAVGRLVEHDVARIVHQRARDRGLDALALREALGAAIGDVAHLQRLDQRIGARCAIVTSSSPCSCAK